MTRDHGLAWVVAGRVTERGIAMTSGLRASPDSLSGPLEFVSRTAGALG
jgi:hypothetical protein